MFSGQNNPHWDSLVTYEKLYEELVASEAHLLQLNEELSQSEVISKAINQNKEERNYWVLGGSDFFTKQNSLDLKKSIQESKLFSFY